jgi:hypothetical protein
VELAKITANREKEPEEQKWSMEDPTEYISSVQKYILWAATNNEGPYKSEEQKIDLIFDEDHLLFSKGYQNTDELNFLDVADKLVFYNNQTSIKDIARSLREHFKVIQAHKCNLLREIYSLENLLQQEVFSRINSEAVASFIQWVETVGV